MDFSLLSAHSNQAVDFAAGVVILVDKPLRWTSFDVVNKIRFAVKHTTKAEAKIKVGHAGTLDPLATGLLLVATGKATKFLDAFQGMDKEYSGHMKLGQSTPSYDGETEPGPSTDVAHLTFRMVRDQANKMTGALQQIPPAYSAIKVEGRRSYRSARKGQVHTLQARKIQVDRFEIVSMDQDRVGFSVACSKGTYIRSLVHDLGLALGVGAWLTDLRRDAIGSYRVENALSMDQLLERISAQVPSGKLADSRGQNSTAAKDLDSGKNATEQQS